MCLMFNTRPWTFRYEKEPVLIVLLLRKVKSVRRRAFFPQEKPISF